MLRTALNEVRREALFVREGLLMAAGTTSEQRGAPVSREDGLVRIGLGRTSVIGVGRAPRIGAALVNMKPPASGVAGVGLNPQPTDLESVALTNSVHPLGPRRVAGSRAGQATGVAPRDLRTGPRRVSAVASRFRLATVGSHDR